MSNFDGRTVIVTGAGGGMGREHALLLAGLGANVVVNDLGGARDGSGNSQSMADAVVSEIEDSGGKAVADYNDVSTVEGGHALVERARAEFGSVDVVVNNAGILRDKTVHKMTPEDWDVVLKVHLYGSFHVTRAALPHMREAKYGRLVMVTSPSGIYGNFGQGNYGAAKSGILGLMKTVALEGRRNNVLANAVSPIATTRMTTDILKEDEQAEFDPRFVSPVVAHLASEECRENGEVIFAAAGRYARLHTIEAEGVQLDHVPSLDELRANWAQIMDLSDFRLGKPGPHASGPV